jgi:hypothetical protein
MPSKNLTAAVACGLAIGAGIATALDASAQRADAQGGFTLSAAQLKTNQAISSAAVKRSNRALNYLAPIRTAATDGADDGTNGVPSLATVPGAGAGWTADQIGDGAVTGAKVADGAVSTPKLGDGAATTAKLADGAATTPKIGDGAVTTAKIGGDAVTDAKLAADLRTRIGELGESTGAYTPGLYSGEPIPTGNFATVLSTSENSGEKRGTGPVSFSEPRRILASGFVDVRETVAATGSANCFLAALSGNTATSFGTAQGSVTVPLNTTVRIPLAGYIDRMPGTYGVGIRCSGGATVEIREMSVNGVVTDQ